MNKSNNEQTMNNEQSSKAEAKDLNEILASENKGKTVAKMVAENAAKDAAAPRKPTRHQEATQGCQASEFECGARCYSTLATQSPQTETQ